MPQVSVIIPTMPGREELLKKLLSTIPDDCEKIVIDDTDLLLAAKRNKGARQAKGDYLLFIDDDNYLHEAAIYYLEKALSYDVVGVVGATACYHDKKRIIADGGSFRDYLSGFTRGLFTNRAIAVWRGEYAVDEVANAFMLRREVFDEVGGFDEKNFPIDLDEADLCKRIKNMGYRIEVSSGAICYHKSQTYSGVPDFRRPMNAYFMGRNKILFQKKHLNKAKYLVYLLVFMPITVAGYAVCLIYRRKPGMFFHFLKGVFDGLRGCYKNKFQQG